MEPANILVTGGNRGFGFGLVKTFLKSPGVKHVFATARRPLEAEDLNRVADPRLTILQMDVTDDESIQKAYAQVAKVVGEEGINLLVNNANIFVDYDPRDKPNRAELIRQLNVNSVSPVVVTQIFLPLIKKAADNCPGGDLRASRAAIVNISSTAGSIGLNDPALTPEFQWPVLIAYRMSKSALNSATRELGNVLGKEGILVACFCPGWVNKGLEGDKVELSPDESMAELVPTIYGLTEKQNGGYFQKNGDVIPF